MKVGFLAIIGLLVNAVLTLLKLAAGFLSGSVAILAEGIHSAADVFSSSVAVWGIRKAGKPADEKHPYGYARYESLASLAVVLLLVIGAAWIIYEAVKSITSGEEIAEFSLLGIIIMAISIVLNEIMARLKFHFGSRQGSQVLVADGQHDRADVVASAAILVGLILVKWIPVADAILAILVGLYILYESIDLTRESVESLVDTANPDLEEKIKKYLKENNFEFDQIKTRKIGNSNFAEIFLVFGSKVQMDKVDAILRKLQNDLIKKINELTSVTLSVKSHSVKSGVLRPAIWGKLRYRRKIEKEREKLNVPKAEGDYRVAIPLLKDKNKIPPNQLGAKFYLLIDLKNNKIIKKETIKNDFYTPEAGRGVKFLNNFRVNKVLSKHIGKGAKENLKGKNIEWEVLEDKTTLKNILDRYR